MRLYLLPLLTSLNLLLTACGTGTTTNVVVNNNSSESSCTVPWFTNATAISLINSWADGLQAYNATNNTDIYVSAGQTHLNLLSLH